MVDSTSGPTVVLVHGAFADAGSWAPVTERHRHGPIRSTSASCPLPAAPPPPLSPQPDMVTDVIRTARNGVGGAS